MTRKSVICLAILLTAGCLPCFADTTDNPRQEGLIRVTLSCDGKPRNAPFDSIAADLVTVDQGKDAKRGETRMVFNGLPGATVSLLCEGPKDDAPIIVTLFAEDDGKAIQLTVKDGVCYKDNIPCTIQFPPNMKGEDRAKQLDALRKAKKDKHTDGLTVALPLEDSNSPVLKELRGSRVGLFLGKGPGKNSLSGVRAAELTRAIGEVEPRQVMIDVGSVALLSRCCSKIEGLSLMTESPPDVIPDLSKFTALRGLTLVNFRGHVDLKPLEKVTHLEALTVFSEACDNENAIVSSARMKFLVMPLKSSGGLSYLKHLPELQYLAAEFPDDEDFSFVEKMPGLQTLCIWNANEKHNLKPLEKLVHLRCLALSQGRDMEQRKPFVAKNYQNVKEFQKARPNVDVVEYRGMCLGSFWIVVLAAAAAAAAWLMRPRLGNRPACQP
jgi:hypothetical protein